MAKVLNSIYVIVLVYLLICLHIAFLPKQKTSVNPLVQETVNEYNDKCISLRIQPSLFYSCEDLKQYLVVRGYNAN